MDQYPTNKVKFPKTSRPLFVQKMGYSYAVINPDGDAELGNFVIAECIFESNAQMIADLINQAEKIQKDATDGK